MRTLVALVALAGVAAAQCPHRPPAGTGPAELMDGLGGHHHPIVTRSAEAQRFFDQGLTLVYAFNHGEAVRSFERAGELDPKSPMPLWGAALALGPNINLDVDPERERAAHAAAQRALRLARDRQERDYAAALARRYSDDPQSDLKQLARDYARAMAELSRRYPDDLDAATLYAESLMNLRPWQLWTLDGQPAENTEEIVAVLESVLARDPDHVGANHYYIHAVEASRHPERALPSAKRLETLVPAAGHLVHMPAHVYMRTGDYEAAVRSNAEAARVDRDYIVRSGATGVYPLLYYSHNLSFLSRAHAIVGRYAEARRTAEAFATNAQPGVALVPMIEYALSTPLFVDLRFGRWREAAQASAAAETPLSRALWHFTRGVAQARLGHRKEAMASRAAFAAARTTVPREAPYGDTGLNRAGVILDLAGRILDARIAAAGRDHAETLAAWRDAVAIDDTLAYEEPPVWYYPVRESLGAALLLRRRHADAEEVFRADLARNPRNPRSLFGLHESLEAQGRRADADWVRRAFVRVWAGGELRIEDL